MEQTIRRAAKVLGASTVEASASGFRFAVEGDQGGRLSVSMGGAQQRFMAILKDAAGITRCTVDVGPVTSVTEDSAFPHRVVVHTGNMLIQLDTAPTLAIEILSAQR